MSFENRFFLHTGRPGPARRVLAERLRAPDNIGLARCIHELAEAVAWEAGIVARLTLVDPGAPTTDAPGRRPLDECPLDDAGDAGACDASPNGSSGGCPLDDAGDTSARDATPADERSEPHA